MSKKTLIATAVGSAFVASMAAAPIASAAENPFALSGLSSGYQVAEQTAAKPAEGKCGSTKATEMKPTDKKMPEGKCGEGKCGANKAKATDAKATDAKPVEGKCGAKK